jgi:pimeloyl-ACP methyl ester carboxylesterase
MQPTGIKGMAATNAVNIVLVHGAGVVDLDQEIPILEKAGHRVIAVQLPEYSLADDVTTVKRVIDLVGQPTILVGHSYGRMVITNAAYNNPNVKGLIYVAAFASQERQSLSNFVDPAKLPKDFLIIDKGGFGYINPKLFQDRLLKMLIRLKMTSWPLCRSQLMYQFLLKSLALLLGNNFRHGTKYLRTIT